MGFGFWVGVLTFHIWRHGGQGKMPGRGSNLGLVFID